MYRVAKKEHLDIIQASCQIENEGLERLRHSLYIRENKAEKESHGSSERTDGPSAPKKARSVVSVFTTQTSSHGVLTFPKQSKPRSLCKPTLESQELDEDGKDCGKESRPTCADDVQAIIELAEQTLKYEGLKKSCEKSRSEEMIRWNEELRGKLKRGRELDEDDRTTSSEVRSGRSSKEASAPAPDLAVLRTSRENSKAKSIEEVDAATKACIARLTWVGMDDGSGAT